MLTHNYAEVNGVRLHYVAAGQGPLILFLHGFPEFWYEWKKQLPEFAQDHLGVAPDMRGYNLSAKPEALDQYRMKHLVEDVRALAEHLGHKKFVLVGHDWGGAVAWAFALAHPECLDKLIIVNAPHPGIFVRELRDNPSQQKASEYMLMFRSPEAEQKLTGNNCDLLSRLLLRDLLNRGAFTEDDRKAYLDAWTHPGAITGGLNYYRANRTGPPAAGETPASFAVDPAMLTVRVPALVIWGEKDSALLVNNLAGLDEFVPDLTIRRVPDASHWIIHEKPAEVNGYIRDFLQRR